MNQRIIFKTLFILISFLFFYSCQGPCLGIGCLNGGVCHEGSCLCPEGFSGENCEFNDSLNNQGCLNGGVIVQGVCECPEGYSGAFCEIVDPCLNINCFNGGVCNQGVCECPEGYSGTFCEIEDSNNLLSTIPCGLDWSENCFEENWSITSSDSAAFYIMPNCRTDKSCLLLYNPIDSFAINPRHIRIFGVIKNIEESQGYKISCEAKIKGYLNPFSIGPFEISAVSNNNWLGSTIYSSIEGEYIEKDWDTYSFNFIGDSNEIIEFRLESIYDSVWIRDLVIQKL